MDSNICFSTRIASVLPSSQYSYSLLKSYYISKSKSFGQFDQHRKSALFGEDELCTKCSLPWRDMNYSLSIVPIQTTKRDSYRIHRQILKKSNRKKHLAKKLTKKANNTVMMKCVFCKQENKIILWKTPNKKSISEPNILLPKTTSRQQQESSNHTEDNKCQISARKINNSKKHETIGKLNIKVGKSIQMKTQQTKTHMKKNTLLQLANVLKKTKPIIAAENKLEHMLK